MDGGLNTYLYVNAKPISSLDQNGKFGFALPALGIAEGLAEGFAAIGGIVGVVVSNAITNSSSDNRGRIQIQNNSGYLDRFPWAQLESPTKIEGNAWLNTLKLNLFNANKKMFARLDKCKAFKRAARFISSGPISAFGGSKSFDCYSSQVNGERVDIEVITGIAFI